MFEEVVRFDVATAVTKGKRDYQEDSLVASFPQGQETGFAVLADGMGGHLSGDVASALVMSEVFSRIKVKEMLLDKQLTDISALLYNTSSAANDRLKEHIKESPETYGMGSTLLATIIRDDELYWVSVGDSPLFLFRDGELRQLNQDHSMAPQIDMMVKVGAMDPETGRNHPDRNTLTSAIAGVDIDKIDCPDEPTKVLPGDIIIVASDGLQFLTNDEIATILQQTKAKHSSEISNALLAALTQHDDPDQDNTAFTIIKLGERQTAEQPATMDKSAVLTQLRTDLGHDAPVHDDTADDVAVLPEPELVAETVNLQEQLDIPTKRVIRLVTSKALTFDKPEEPPQEAAPIQEAQPKARSLWSRR